MQTFGHLAMYPDSREVPLASPGPHIPFPVDNEAGTGLPYRQLIRVARPAMPGQNVSTVDGRLSSLETKVNLLIALAFILLAAAGVAYWKLWDIGRDLGALSSKVDLYDNEAIMKILSAVQTDGEETPAARELKRTVQRIVDDTMQKNKKGEAVPPGLFYELGIFSANNGRPEEAVTYFQRATEANRLDYRAFSSLGASYIMLGDRSKDRKTYYATKAIEPLKNAIEINPNHAKAHNNLGIAYYMTKQRDAAIREWNTAIKIERDFEAPYYNLACMYAAEGQTQEALKFLGEAIVNHGYDRLAEIEADEQRCFARLRRHPRFVELKTIVAERNRTLVAP